MLALAVVAALLIAGCGRSDSEPEADAGPARHVLVIGIDGLDWERFERLAAEGRLPNLARLEREGASGVLYSLSPYVSPVIWTSIATGKVGEKHGVEWFTAGSDQSDLVGSGLIKCRTLWEILPSAGMSSGVVGWLVSYPAVPVTSYTVTSRAVMALSDPSGGTASSIDSSNVKGLVHPQTLWSEIHEAAVTTAEVSEEDLASYLGSSERPDTDFFENRMDGLTKMIAADRTTLECSLKLMGEYPTELTAVYFRGNDIVSHFFWRFWEPESWTRGKLKPEMVEALAPVIDVYYETVDDMIGHLIEAAPQDAVVIVCSDHGFAGHRGNEEFRASRSGEIAFAINMHRDKGVVFVSGPGVARGARLEAASVLDIAPTVLTLLGLPTARDMDGKPLVDALDPSFLKGHPVTYVDTYEVGERASVDAQVESPVDEQEKELLRSLGYID